MKDKTRYIILLVLLAGLGLLASQMYWLWYTYDIKRQEFEKDINEGLSEALELVMVMQTRDLVVKRFRTKPAWSKEGNVSVQENTSVIIVPGDSMQQQDQITIAAYFSQGDSVVLDDTATSPRLYQRSAGLGAGIDSLVRIGEVDQFMHKVFSTLVEQKLDLEDLDSLYRQKLTARQIDMEFQLSLLYKDSVLSHFGAELPVKDNGIEAIAQDNGLLPPGYFVQAVFTQFNSFLFWQMSWILTGALLLILITLGSFVYLLRVIFRQKRLSAIKNDFIDNMTHELKTPISILSAAHEALTRFNGLEDRSNTERYLEVFKQETERLNAMVEKVLHISVYEQPNFKLERSAFDLHETLSLLAERHQLKNPDLDIQLEMRLENPVLQLDNEHFSNVLNNLLDNAIKYSDPPQSVRIRTYKEGGSICIDFEDNGIGIAPAHQQSIFEKFFRVPTGDLHNVKGFGLGLSYVHKIVTLHQGTVHLRSRLGKGSTFTIKMPSL
ncbi:MAG: HAMP domain-containing histidine kinase [Phaeodactylibacter sp.]|nr:HAMP domain-containing histidine kinase [Phaeodactylibacter sp.]